MVVWNKPELVSRTPECTQEFGLVAGTEALYQQMGSDPEIPQAAFEKEGNNQSGG
jgi:hypothetical protein